MRSRWPFNRAETLILLGVILAVLTLVCMPLVAIPTWVPFLEDRGYDDAWVIPVLQWLQRARWVIVAVLAFAVAAPLVGKYVLLKHLRRIPSVGARIAIWSGTPFARRVQNLTPRETTLLLSAIINRDTQGRGNLPLPELELSFRSHDVTDDWIQRVFDAGGGLRSKGLFARFVTGEDRYSVDYELHAVVMDAADEGLAQEILRLRRGRGVFLRGGDPSGGTQ